MTFTKTSVKFGQWSDSRANTVYGLGFSSEGELLKFIEKFKEVKELTRQIANKTPTPGGATTNGSTPTPDHALNEISNLSNLSISASPVGSPKTPVINTSVNATAAVNHDPIPVPLTERTSTPALPEQLKYENDRLKIALAQSSANAKKWEVELQTLKNNNARLTTALQESTANVEEWKKQLAIYKEESNRLKKKVMDSEKSGGGSELLQRQLADMRDKVTEMEKINAQKQEEISSLNKRLEEMRSAESQRQQLMDRFQSLEHEKDSLQKQNQSLKEHVDGMETSRAREKQQIRSVQEQIGSRVGDLYGLSDKLADLLQH